MGLSVYKALLVKDQDDPYISAYSLSKDKKFLDFGDTTGISKMFQVFLGIVAVNSKAIHDFAVLFLHYHQPP
jgi:hypothetical protein